MQEIIQLFAAFLGSLGFAVLFNIRGEKLVFAALGGLLSWGVYLGAGYIDNNPYFCGFTASVLLTLYAECMARVHKTPVTVFLVSAAIPLIPGAGLYRAMSSLLFMQNVWLVYTKRRLRFFLYPPQFLLFREQGFTAL